VSLVLIDEVHLLGEADRGSSLEAGVVSRIKSVAAFPEMKQVRCCKVSSFGFGGLHEDWANSLPDAALARPTRLYNSAMSY
jgi:hypothetical protein